MIYSHQPIRHALRQRLKGATFQPLMIAGLTMASLPSLAQGNLIVNGSFEDPPLSSGAWEIYPYSSSIPAIPGWTVTFGS
ncbi:MAG: hypothetical protein KIT22_03200 [Verrucomicrobiae bacterium]|nr:hypothetical protein [Verrucomicrobiae bacterium]